MNRKEIEKVVVRAVAAELRCPPKEVATDGNLEEMGIDSLKAITILYSLEDQFHFIIENDAVERVKTVTDITDMLCELLLRGSTCED